MRGCGCGRGAMEADGGASGDRLVVGTKAGQVQQRQTVGAIKQWASQTKDAGRRVRQ